jgi:hypothetical protein
VNLSKIGGGFQFAGNFGFQQSISAGVPGPGSLIAPGSADRLLWAR